MTGPNWSKVISVMSWLILLLKSSMALAAVSTAFAIGIVSPAAAPQSFECSEGECQWRLGDRARTISGISLR